MRRRSIVDNANMYLLIIINTFYKTHTDRAKRLLAIQLVSIYWE